MKLTETIKKQILDILDSKEFMSDLYEGLDEKKRIELGQFYTPGKICIQMLEKFKCNDFSNQDILDPTVGSGNLLIAMLIAGADSHRIYGNEYDEIAVELCRKRINRACDILGKPHIRDWQIHQGNALHKFALVYFDEDYEEMYFDGKTQPAARKRKLENVSYDAYTMSNAFKHKYPDLYREELNLKEDSTAQRNAEQSNTYNLW